jgi:Skp family chaperone for outer membrane proteins
MTEDKKPRRTRRLLDAIIITTVSSVIATVVAGIALVVFQRVYHAEANISVHTIKIQNLRKDLTKTQELLAEELAPIKAHLHQLEHDPLLLEEIYKLREEIEKKFENEANNQVQQQGFRP